MFIPPWEDYDMMNFAYIYSSFHAGEEDYGKSLVHGEAQKTSPGICMSVC